MLFRFPLHCVELHHYLIYAPCLAEEFWIRSIIPDLPATHTEASIFNSLLLGLNSKWTLQNEGGY